MARIQSNILLIACCGLLGLLSVSQTNAEEEVEQRLATRLFAEGMGPVRGVILPLAEPVLHRKPLGAERLEAAMALVPRIGWKRFSTNSVNAPVSIKVNSIKDSAGQLIAHDIRCSFVVHASIELLRDRELMTTVFADQKTAPENESGQQLSAEVLKEMQIATSEDTSYGVAKLPLFNRIEVEGVLRAEKQTGDDWLGVVWQFDPRFTSGQYRNVWRKIERNKLGEPVASPPQPYEGCGGYIVVHQLEAGSEMMLVESRIVMHEPTEWFNGSSYLRSKLPTGLQENARSFRRKLANAKQK